MSDDTELEDWRRQWRELGGRDDLARSLSERVGKDRQRLWRELIAECVAAAASTLLCVWLLVDSRGKPVVVVACAGALLYTGAWVTRLLTLKLAAARTDAVALEAFIELTRRRLAADIRWQTFEWQSVRVMPLLVLPWALWAVWHRYSLYVSEPWRAATELGLLVGLGVGAFIRIPRKLRRLEAARDRFEALIDERTLR